MYSAVKIGGRKLYDLAREGKEIERSARHIQVKRIQLLSVQEKQGCYQMEIHCSKGTYIRTLCHDMGAALGCGAMVTELRRIQSGRFRLEDAISLPQIQQLINLGRSLPFLSVEEAFEAYPPIELDSRLAKLWSNGVKLSPFSIFFSLSGGAFADLCSWRTVFGTGLCGSGSAGAASKKTIFSFPQ